MGALTTREEIGPDFAAVRVTLTLYVRTGDRWAAAGNRSATVRSADAAGGGDDLARDPQVAAVFQVFESIGFGVAPEVKQRALNLGAATRKALGQARSAFNDRLQALALPLEEEGP